ncbi:MAG: hypothetical protein MUF78_05450 [Candidatus Edwardsbacteria bacterium]|nr:hypothetical protein [Candidatus Edwardsbacteria bacterium]
MALIPQISDDARLTITLTSFSVSLYSGTLSQIWNSPLVREPSITAARNSLS